MPCFVGCGTKVQRLGKKFAAEWSFKSIFEHFVNIEDVGHLFSYCPLHHISDRCIINTVPKLWIVR